MIRAVAIFFALLSIIPVAGVSGQERPAGETSLAQELEGLAPEPRIAYLRHLLASRARDPEVHFQLGVAFQEGGELDSALYYYGRAVEIDSTLSKAYVNMGVLWDGRRRSDRALELFEKAIEIRPDDLLAHAHAAYLLIGRKDWEGAWKHLDRALAIDPLDPQPHFYFAIFFWECGMYRESLAEWERVVALSPGSPIALQAEKNIELIQRALTEAQAAREAVSPEKR